jgi:hypothetical protein
MTMEKWAPKTERWAPNLKRLLLGVALRRKSGLDPAAYMGRVEAGRSTKSLISESA